MQRKRAPPQRSYVHRQWVGHGFDYIAKYHRAFREHQSVKKQTVEYATQYSVLQ